MNQTKKKIVINLIGGPGCGKSTVAAEVFSYLKKRKVNVELVQEFVKSWAYEGKIIKDIDQLYFFAKQMYAEDFFFRNGVSVVVTDCPLQMSIVYCNRFCFPFADELNSMYKFYMSDKKSLNIYLTRDNIEYNEKGRYQSEEQSVKVDREIQDHMKKYDIDYYPLDATKISVGEYVKEFLDNEN